MDMVRRSQGAVLVGSPAARTLLRILVVSAMFLGLGAARATADVGYTEKALKFDVVVGPSNNIHCVVDANLYTPDGASAAHPVAAILATNGFGGSKDDFNKLAPSYAKRGFAFLAYSGLGFGGSGCKIELDDPDYDGKAGSQLVSFLGGSKAAQDGTKINYIIRDPVAHDGKHYPDDPRVGMLGGSYGGEIQFAVAEQDLRVDAINPQITWSDLAYSLIPNNTDFTSGVTSATPGVVKVDWPTLFFGLGVGDGIQEIATNGDASHVGACPNFDDRACPSIVTAAGTSYPDATTLAFLRHASVASYIKNIRIPTFLAQGEVDSLFDLQEATATYRELRAQGTPVRMLWRSAGHSGGSLGNAESDAANPEAGYESRLELQWFQYYLQGDGPAPKLDFSFYRPWVHYSGDAAPAVGEVPSYPAAPSTTLDLSGTNALTSSPASVQAGSASMAAVSAAPSSTGGGYVNPGDVNPPGTAVTYATPPLTADTNVIGIPAVTFRISAPTFATSQAQGPGGMLELFAKVDDYNPVTGTATLPQNLVSAVRIPDVNAPITIQLPGIVYRFPKGDEIRLVIGTSDETFRGNNSAGPVTVMTSPSAPGVLSLPISTGSIAGLSTPSVSRVLPGCPAPTGGLSGATLGLIRLGLTRARAHRAYVHSSDRGQRYKDFFCLAPIGIRVGYGSPTLLRTIRARARARYRDRVVWISTANPFYSVRGVRPGARVNAAHRRLRLGRPFHVGLNWWYFGHSGATITLLKVRHGRIEEVGIAMRSLTRTRKMQAAFVRSFS
ncbi:MAG: CocE/NonD family hydrolase [Solirubrobacteraceae bacterium]